MCVRECVRQVASKIVAAQIGIYNGMLFIYVCQTGVSEHWTENVRTKIKQNNDTCEQIER